MKKNENTLHLTRKINDNNIKQKVTQTLETLPSSDDTDALVSLANDLIRTGRENRQRNSHDMSKQIPVIIKNTFNPTAKGTLITKVNENSQLRIQGISSIDDVSLLTVQGSGMIGETGISMRLFRAIAQETINVILITQSSSEHSITFAVLPNEAKKAQKVLNKEFAFELESGLIDSIRIENDLSIIAAPVS